jgi:hypothetical protein
VLVEKISKAFGKISKAKTPKAKKTKAGVAKRKILKSVNLDVWRLPRQSRG